MTYIPNVINVSDKQCSIKPYYKNNFLNNLQTPTVANIIEYTINTNTFDIDDISAYQRIGKILENNHLYNDAIDLYKKGLDLIPLNSQLNKTEADEKYKSLCEDYYRAIDKNNNENQSLDIRG